MIFRCTDVSPISFNNFTDELLSLPFNNIVIFVKKWQWRIKNWRDQNSSFLTFNHHACCEHVQKISFVIEKIDAKKKITLFNSYAAMIFLTLCATAQVLLLLLNLFGLLMFSLFSDNLFVAVLLFDNNLFLFMCNVLN